MTHAPQAKTGVIWYNPIEKEYQYGSWASYNHVAQKEDEGAIFDVLYETDAMTTRLASKIVKELNLASAKAEPA